MDASAITVADMVVSVSVTLGFEEVPLRELSAQLVAVVQHETPRGLDPTRRVVMRRPSAASRPGDRSVTISAQVASND